MEEHIPYIRTQGLYDFLINHLHPLAVNRLEQNIACSHIDALRTAKADDIGICLEIFGEFTEMLGVSS